MSNVGIPYRLASGCNEVTKGVIYHEIALSQTIGLETGRMWVNQKSENFSEYFYGSHVCRDKESFLRHGYSLFPIRAAYANCMYAINGK